MVAPPTQASPTRPVVLVLAGTTEARVLVETLREGGGREVVASLAGRTAAPLLDGRVGGFGGPEALAAWTDAHRVAAVVDATHPFAARMSAHAAQACAATGTPRLRLLRPGWTAGPGDRWTRVVDLAAAAAAVREGAGRRVLLALGGGGAAAFAGVQEPWFLVRSIEPPTGPLPPRHAATLDRGPFDLDAERRLLDEHDIDLVVARDAGGDAGRAKLDAARERGTPVLLVDRPPPPAGPAAATVAEAVAWLDRHAPAGDARADEAPPGVPGTGSGPRG